MAHFLEHLYGNFDRWNQIGVILFIAKFLKKSLSNIHLRRISNPLTILPICILTSDIFIQNHLLFMFLRDMCKKKVWQCDSYMSHRSYRESIIYHQIHNVLLSPLSMWPYVLHITPKKCCCWMFFIAVSFKDMAEYFKDIFRIIIIPGGSNDTSFSSPGNRELSNAS